MIVFRSVSQRIHLIFISDVDIRACQNQVPNDVYMALRGREHQGRKQGGAKFHVISSLVERLGRPLFRSLVIAARDVQGQLHTLQFIGEDGSKRFLTGGRIVGCYFAIGQPAGSLLLCEGLATASTLHQATGQAVAVAFNCGNLMAVARALRSKFPSLRLVVCADNDSQSPGNPGVTHARAAAKAVGGFVAIPQFQTGPS